MQVPKIENPLIRRGLANARNAITSPKAAEFAKTTVCAISVETTLKALGRPAFIYYDKHANGQSKKYAATKELLYQSFCLGLYLSFIKPIKKRVYSFMSEKAKNSKENGAENTRKLKLFDDWQNKIKNAPDKNARKLTQKAFHKALSIDKDLHFGKGVSELSSIISTVFILALCAPILSQIILHPVMDLLFKNNGNKKVANNNLQQQGKNISVKA